VFAGLVHPDQPADPPQQILFINQPLQYFSLTEPAKFQTSEQAESPVDVSGPVQVQPMATSLSRKTRTGRHSNPAPVSHKSGGQQRAAGSQQEATAPDARAANASPATVIRRSRTHLRLPVALTHPHLRATGQNTTFRASGLLNQSPPLPKLWEVLSPSLRAVALSRSPHPSPSPSRRKSRVVY
jgi:hypothetical protein